MQDLSAIGPFPLGVNNRKRAQELTGMVGRSNVDLLRSAANVDVSQSGKVSRREGFALLHAGRAHSAWGDDSAAFYFQQGTLYHLSLPPDGELTRTVIRTDLAPTAPLSYCEAGGTYYYTNGQEIGMVRNKTRLDFPPTPTLTPTLSATAGSLAPGRYNVCITHFSDAGESAATRPQTIRLVVGGGIRVASIPAAPAGCITLIYLTETDGEVFGRVALNASSSVVDIVAPQSAGASCQTLMLEAMPAGSIVRFSNGRLLVAAGSVLHYSEPFMLGLHNPGKNYIPFSAPITVVEPCDRGVFVVADKTYWISGEITGATLQEALPYGAVPRTGGRDPLQADTCFWVSDRGLVFGSADGSVKNVQQDQLALDGGLTGASVYREREGQRHVITSVRDPSHTNTGVGFRFEAEVIKKGVSQ